MSVKSFTERELELIKLALQCVENPKLDVAKYQALGGFATLGSARASWWNLKVKLGVNTSRPGVGNAEDSTNNPAPAAAETPKNRKRKLATSPSDDSPTAIKKRTKQVSKSARAKEPEETQVKQEASPQVLAEGNGSPQ